MRVTRPARRLAALVVLLGGASACSSDRPGGPTEPAATTLDVGPLLSAMTLPTGLGAVPLAVMAGVPAPALSGAPPAGLGRCTWSDAAQAFACAPVTLGGQTISYQWAPLDAAGRVQRQPDRAATAAIRTLSTSAGTIALPGGATGLSGSVATERRQEMTLSGLLTGRRTLDGASTTSVAGSIVAPGGGTLALRTRVEQTVAGLVLPAEGARWPAAGTVTTVVAEQGASAPTFRQVLTFDGTSTVTVEQTVAGTTRRCTLDLAAAGPMPRCGGM
ncbi:MAG TPA: hypothetical protein VEZ47_01045 [Gemmatirosa sp.]|nr:hypothetical protein [Gemmatirosa sp.]